MGGRAPAAAPLGAGAAAAGVASLSEAITLVEGLPARVLARADGERELTDLRHVGQLLHAAATHEQLGTAALTAWLRRRIADAEQEAATRSAAAGWSPTPRPCRC